MLSTSTPCRPGYSIHRTTCPPRARRRLRIPTTSKPKFAAANRNSAYTPATPAPMTTNIARGAVWAPARHRSMPTLRYSTVELAVEDPSRRAPPTSVSARIRRLDVFEEGHESVDRVGNSRRLRPTPVGPEPIGDSEPRRRGSRSNSPVTMIAGGRPARLVADRGRVVRIVVQHARAPPAGTAHQYPPHVGDQR